MNQLYTVSLQGCEDVPARVRIDGEVRFARELERVLGGEQAVTAVYAAWLQASECEMSQLDAATAATAVRWPRAADTARIAGFSRLGDLTGAYFDVRLERQAADVH